MQVHITQNLLKFPCILFAEVKPLQGKLKHISDTNYQKLKASIVEKGFCFPIFIWQHDSINYLIDGHQRQIVFEIEGWEIPVPYINIEADTIEEAKEKLLLCTSQYGTITPEGLSEFSIGLDWDWVSKSVSFDAIPIIDFFDLKNEENYELKQPEYEKPKSDKSNTCKCPNCGHEFEPK